MKILFVGLARAIRLFELAELNPTGKTLQPVIEGIGKQYQFAKIPQNITELGNTKGLAFEAGTFRNSKDVPILVTLKIFSDGFVVDTMSSTDDSTAFLVDLNTWLKQEFDIQIPSHARKGFLSQIDFECETSMSHLDPNLDDFAKRIESLVKPADGRVRHFELGALNFWTEDVNVPGAPPIVKFERKISAPFAANHYFSQAPVETDAHKQLLLEFELLLRSSVGRQA
jgi:hypothetical protein